MTSKQTSRLGRAPEEGIKAPVVTSTSESVVLEGLLEISSVQLTEGDRVLVKDQSDKTINGIYNASVGTWERATDWNKSNDVINGQLVLDASTSQLFRASFDGDFNINSTPVDFFSVVITDLDTETVASLTPLNLEIGTTIRTTGYYSSGDGGGATYYVSTAAIYGRGNIDYADHTLPNGNIAFLVPDNLASIPAEQCGVSYGGPNVIETTQLQAAVDVGWSIRNAQPDTDSAFEVQINGHVRIDDTITEARRCTFKGVNNGRARIIWAGGYHATKAMIDFGSASWGGLIGIRLEGYDPDVGQTPMVDGVANLLSYTFIDFNHILRDVHFFSGHSDIIKLTAGVGESALTNYNLTNIFVSNVGEGYLLKITSALGGKRVINIVGMTVNNRNYVDATQPYTGGIVDTSDTTGGFAINVIGSRIEYNEPTYKADFAMFNIGSTSEENSGRSTVNLNNVVGYVSGFQGNFPMVRAVDRNTVKVSHAACNFQGLSLIQYQSGEYDTLTDGDFSSSEAGMLVAQNVIGRSSIFSGNYVDRTSDKVRQFVKRGDIVFCNDGTCDYMIPDIEEGNDLSYSYATTGFTNVGKIESLNSGSAVAVLSDTALTVRMKVGLAVRVTGAGVAGGNLDTHIVALDPIAETVTFNDSASTTVGLTTILPLNADWIQGFLQARETTPPNLTSQSVGQSVYVKDRGCTLTWDGTRWMYSSEYTETTGNRPTYVNTVANIGLNMFDTTLGKPIWWTGTAWVDATGSVV